jgi:hypothetical protein
VATLGHFATAACSAFRAEKQDHWLAGLESAFTTFGGVPEAVLMMDNPRALLVRHDAVTGRFSSTITYRVREASGLRACAPISPPAAT